jgi:spermidine/putrescine transport system permease protein
MKRFKHFAIPYVIWLGLLVLLPLILLTLISFSSTKYTLAFDSFRFSVDHVSTVFTAQNLMAFYNSIKLAFLATIGCVIFGYPVSYIISMSKIKNKYLTILLILFPMWICMLLRLKIINNMLSEGGLLESFFGISLNISGTEFAVVLVMILMYMPFMILPIFTQLQKIDRSLFEASQDLGATPFKTFLKVTLPLSMKGVTSGIIMVFLPAATGFAIPEIIGNGKINLIGNVIENYISGAKGVATQYNIGCMISLIIIIVVIGSLVIISKIDAEGETLL